MVTIQPKRRSSVRSLLIFAHFFVLVLTHLPNSISEQMKDLINEGKLKQLKIIGWSKSGQKDMETPEVHGAIYA
jgi:hypothetical protein